MSDHTDKILFNVMSLFFSLALIFAYIYKFIAKVKIFSIIYMICFCIWLVLLILELAMGFKMARDDHNKKK